MTDTNLPGCNHCDATIDSTGTVAHESKCPLHALHRIGHILKEVGITAVEDVAKVATSGLGAMQDE